MIELPWPSASLSGHAKGFWRDKANITRRHRHWAKVATLAANLDPIPDKGDIQVAVTFYPPDNRADRVNYPNRLKPYFDGIAEAIGVNDRRFLPRFHFAEPVGRGKACVVFTLVTAL